MQIMPKKGTAAACAVALGLAAPAIASDAWFYATADGKTWCAFGTEASARNAAKSGRFENGASAMVRYHGGIIEGVTILTQSEDSFAEDTYQFDLSLQAMRVTRRGGYAEQPVVNVTFTRDRIGKLALDPASQAAKRRTAHAQRETYFLDWPLYAGFAQMPFTSLVTTQPVVRVALACRPARR